jgi:hypothetical protein
MTCSDGQHLNCTGEQMQRGNNETVEQYWRDGE